MFRENSLPLVIWCGGNRKGKIVEYAGKRIMNVVNWDDYIHGEVKGLIRIHPDIAGKKEYSLLGDLRNAVLSPFRADGEDDEDCKTAPTSLEFAIRAALESRFIDKGRIIVVGPKESIEEALSQSDLHDKVTVAEQGDNLGENTAAGVFYLNGLLGYGGELAMFFGSDIPCITGHDIDSVVENSMARKKEDADAYMGYCLKQDFEDYLVRTGMSERFFLNSSIKERFNPDSINKFGLNIIDDTGILSEGSKESSFLNGNVFLMNIKRNNHEDIAGYINRAYNMRKIVPKLPQLIYSFGIRNSWDILRGRGAVSQIEAVLSNYLSKKVVFTLAPGAFADDFDTGSDLKRISDYVHGKSLNL